MTPVRTLTSILMTLTDSANWLAFDTPSAVTWVVFLDFASKIYIFLKWISAQMSQVYKPPMPEMNYWLHPDLFGLYTGVAMSGDLHFDGRANSHVDCKTVPFRARSGEGQQASCNRASTIIHRKERSNSHENWLQASFTNKLWLSRLRTETNYRSYYHITLTYRLYELRWKHKN